MSNRIDVHVPITTDTLHGKEDLSVEATFDIPIKSQFRAMTIIGIISFVIGILLFVTMMIFFIANFPETWLNLDGDELDAQLRIKELTGVLAMLSGTGLLAGLTLYTFGRTFQGDQDLEALAGDQGGRAS